MMGEGDVRAAGLQMMKREAMPFPSWTATFVSSISAGRVSRSFSCTPGNIFSQILLVFKISASGKAGGRPFSDHALAKDGSMSAVARISSTVEGGVMTVRDEVVS